MQEVYRIGHNDPRFIWEVVIEKPVKDFHLHILVKSGDRVVHNDYRFIRIDSSG